MPFRTLMCAVDAADRSLPAITAARWLAGELTSTAVRGPVDWLLAGSVSAQLAARAPCPVLAVPRDATVPGSGPVVCGYDGSDHALRAARHASSLARALGRDLVLAHVGRDEVPAGGHGDLESAAAALGATALAVREGDPGEELSRLAVVRDAAVVVAGTRGRGPVAAAVLGSLSAALVRSAARPVMLVPATAGS